MPIVEVRNVSKRFANGVQALDGISLAFEPGEVVAILGPSGSGKSTLLRCINGLETPTLGSIVVDGVPVVPKNYRAVRRQVGMVFQQFHLVPRLSVLANVLTGSLGRTNWLSGLLFVFPQGEIQAATQAIQRVGLSGREHDRAMKLSGGQQQRVAIARSVLHHPRVLLADEPVASLDPAISVEVLDLLVHLAREAEMTLLLNLHQVELAQQYCDRILGLRQGRLLFDSSSKGLDRVALEELYGKSAVA